MLLCLAAVGVSSSGLTVLGILHFAKGSSSSADKTLARALDAWLFGDYGLQTRDGISFYDDDRILIHSKLMKYEISSSRPAGNGKTEFSVILVLESKRHTELRQSRRYAVYRWNGKWKVAQADPSLREWLDVIKEDAKEGRFQEKARQAAHDLASGSYRRDYDADSMRAFKELELQRAIALGKAETLRKQFRLIEEKKEELHRELTNEEDPGIRETLTAIISGLEELASLEQKE